MAKHERSSARGKRPRREWASVEEVYAVVAQGAAAFTSLRLHKRVSVKAAEEALERYEAFLGKANADKDERLDPLRKHIEREIKNANPYGPSSRRVGQKLKRKVQQNAGRSESVSVSLITLRKNPDKPVQEVWQTHEPNRIIIEWAS